MVLITGGFGYLGGRIAKYLIKSGETVIIGSRQTDRKLPNEIKKAYGVVEIDLLSIKTLKKSCNGIETIIHLAGMNAKECYLDPQQALLINGLGVLNLLHAAKQCNVKNFILFSTIHVYGDPLTGNLDENKHPKPNNAYSITNRLAEDYVIESTNKKEINGCIFRLSNAIGSPLTKDVNCWSLVANDLCKQIIQQREMVLNANYLIQRDFISIHEICRITYFMLKRGLTTSNCEVYNLSSGNSTTLKELLNIIAFRAGKTIDIRHINMDCKSLDKKTPLSFKVPNAKIKNLGVHISTDISDEIDSLLLNCSKWF